jgi:GTPase Era involved in 16S rRNA processing
MGGSFGKKKSKIIIVGLDNSGKSTMINMLKPKKVSIIFMNLIDSLRYIIKREKQTLNEF